MKLVGLRITFEDGHRVFRFKLDGKDECCVRQLRDGCWIVHNLDRDTIESIDPFYNSKALADEWGVHCVIDDRSSEYAGLLSQIDVPNMNEGMLNYYLNAISTPV